MYNRYISLFTISTALLGSSIVLWYITVWLSHVGKKPKRPLVRIRNEAALRTASWEKIGRVTELYIYPIKSCAGTSVNKAYAMSHGFSFTSNTLHSHDRCFLIIDSKGEMVRGHKYPGTVLIKPFYDTEKQCITLSTFNLPPLKLELDFLEIEGTPTKGKLWDEIVPGIYCGEEASEWLKLALGMECHLLYHGHLSPLRTVSPKEQYPLLQSSDSSLYADLTGYMLMSASSLQDLQSKLQHSIATQQFRPNIVVHGCTPFDEDKWTYIKIGDAIFRNAKPCDRCVFTTVDCVTGKRHPKLEPLRTLRKYRLPDNSEAPHFGINLGLDVVGKVEVEDEVWVLRD